MAKANRSSIYLLLAITPVAWGGLLLFTRFVPPHTLFAFLVFFAILCVALTGTFTPVTYVLGRTLLSRLRYRVTMGHAVRQSLLLSLVVILNLILRALHSWNIFMAIVILVAAIILEVLALARK